jgi:hypothetical protein
MPISTYNVTLKSGADAATLTKLCDIIDFPDLGGAPERLETTTLSDAAQTFINGIKSTPNIEFTANYTKTDFSAIDAKANTKLYYALEFGEAGADGIFEWQGEHVVWVTGAGKNAVVLMKIGIAPSTEIKLKTA